VTFSGECRRKKKKERRKSGKRRKDEEKKARERIKRYRKRRNYFISISFRLLGRSVINFPSLLAATFANNILVKAVGATDFT
jgi:hypothetical protein